MMLHTDVEKVLNEKCSWSKNLKMFICFVLGLVFILQSVLLDYVSVLFQVLVCTFC